MKPLLHVVMAIAILLNPLITLANPSEDRAVEKFLAEHKSVEDREETELRGMTTADLDNDGVPEIVLVWTTLGPTYWRNTLSVLKKTTGHSSAYREAASIPLNGEATLDRVQFGVIAVKQKMHAPNDPTCCPSIQRVMQYQWANGKLVPIK